MAAKRRVPLNDGLTRDASRLRAPLPEAVRCGGHRWDVTKVTSVSHTDNARAAGPSPRWDLVTLSRVLLAHRHNRHFRSIKPFVAFAVYLCVVSPLVAVRNPSGIHVEFAWRDARWRGNRCAWGWEVTCVPPRSRPA